MSNTYMIIKVLFTDPVTRMNRLSGFAAALFGALFLTTATTLPASAQEWIFGLGYSNFSRAGSVDSAQVAVEYQHTPFFENGRFSAGAAGVLSVQTEGDVFVGAGITGKFRFDNSWFIETSVMPGAFFESQPANDLGSTFEIRSLLGVGYEFSESRAMSLAILHKSNASTATINPGVNTVLLRWHGRF